MGDSPLSRGFFPGSAASGAPSPQLQVQWLWLVFAYHAHHFSRRPIGEALASWTTILLIENGHDPTIGDIARASGLPRATVSRYVQHQLHSGWLEECVNLNDRRRRELQLTPAGLQMLEQIVDSFHELFHEVRGRGWVDGEAASGAEMLEHLAEMSATIAARAT
jgi:DNA-binding MarR family transcriptional regulator